MAAEPQLRVDWRAKSRTVLGVQMDNGIERAGLPPAVGSLLDEYPPGYRLRPLGTTRAAAAGGRRRARIQGGVRWHG